MAVVPIISQSWDSSSYVNPTRMNNIETNIATVSKATGVEYSSGVSVKDKLDAITNKNEVIAIPNIGQHKSIKITLADSDTFCVATFAGASGGAKNAMYLITASASVAIFQNDYSITKNSDRVFTVTSTDYWTRALIQAFAPNPNSVSYEVLN